MWIRRFGRKRARDLCQTIINFVPSKAAHPGRRDFVGAMPPEGGRNWGAGSTRKMSLLEYPQITDGESRVCRAPGRTCSSPGMRGWSTYGNMFLKKNINATTTERIGRERPPALCPNILDMGVAGKFHLRLNLARAMWGGGTYGSLTPVDFRGSAR